MTILTYVHSSSSQLQQRFAAHAVTVHVSSLLLSLQPFLRHIFPISGPTG